MQIRSGLFMEAVILHQWEEHCEITGRMVASDEDFCDVIFYSVSTIYPVAHPHFGDGTIIVSDGDDYFVKMELYDVSGMIDLAIRDGETKTFLN